MKYFLYILCPVLLLFGSYACDSENDPVYPIEARWRVLEDGRKFTCESNKTLENRVNLLLNSQALKDGEWSYLNFSNGNYLEGDMKWETIGGGETGLPEESFLLAQDRLKGVFSIEDEDQIKVSVQNIGSQWHYTLDIVDHNNEFMWVKQEMNNKDIETFFVAYFSTSITVAEGVTATWETKLAKVKDE